MRLLPQTPKQRQAHDDNNEAIPSKPQRGIGRLHITNPASEIMGIVDASMYLLSDGGRVYFAYATGIQMADNRTQVAPGPLRS